LAFPNSRKDRGRLHRYMGRGTATGKSCLVAS